MGHCSFDPPLQPSCDRHSHNLQTGPAGFGEAVSNFVMCDFVLKSFIYNFEVMLGYFGSHVGIQGALGTLLGTLRVIAFWTYVGSMLEPFWNPKCMY